MGTAGPPLNDADGPVLVVLVVILLYVAAVWLT